MKTVGKFLLTLVAVIVSVFVVIPLLFQINIYLGFTVSILTIYFVIRWMIKSSELPLNYDGSDDSTSFVPHYTKFDDFYIAVWYKLQEAGIQDKPDREIIRWYYEGSHTIDTVVKVYTTPKESFIDHLQSDAQLQNG